MYDLYVPLVKNYEKTWTFEEAKELILKALAPLGETYIKDLNNLFNSNCIDVYYNTKVKKVVLIHLELMIPYLMFY